jgi:predicted enzyme related to lactoylglutathione lyase
MSDVNPDQNALNQGRAFVWHELYVPDLDKAKEFYGNALDMGSQTMDMGPMAYNMLTVNGVPVCGMVSTNDPNMAGVPPHWAVYLAVDDVDARIEKVTANGGKVMVPAMDIPTVGRMALIVDPQGAHIWLFKPNLSQA